MIITSISLPNQCAIVWRKNRESILQFSDRFLRMKMCLDLRRGVSRTYNCAPGEYSIVSVRFSEVEYDAFHYLAASLRVSVSSLIYELIKLWLKPARRRTPQKFCANYSINQITWGTPGGILEESLTFWSRNTDGTPRLPMELLTN